MKLIKDIRVSDNFMLSEFACHDTEGSVFIEYDLIQKLQKLRNVINLPLHINSAYRSLEYNRSIGSNDTSQHVLGKAVDIQKIPGYTDEQFVMIAEACGFKGIGVYPTFYHVDVRDDKARW